MKMLTCPHHGELEPYLQWFRADGLHLGAVCQCGLVLRWMPHDTRGAPPAVSVKRW